MINGELIKKADNVLERMDPETLRKIQRITTAVSGLGGAAGGALLGGGLGTGYGAIRNLVRDKKDKTTFLDDVARGAGYGGLTGGALGGLGGVGTGNMIGARMQDADEAFGMSGPLPDFKDVHQFEEYKKLLYKNLNEVSKNRSYLARILGWY